MAKRATGKRPARGQRQIPGAPPIIEDPRLPRMGQTESTLPTGRQLKLMPKNPEPDTGRRNRMGPVRATGSKRTGRPPVRGLPDQQPRGRRASPTAGDADSGDGYLRLRVLVDEGKLSIAGAKVVEGPLVQDPVLTSGLAWEVTVGGRRLAAGQIQDAGVWRSFPDPSGRPALSGHHITVVRSYEIAVRIPLTALLMAQLRRASITLYRWRGDAVSTEGTEPLKKRMRRVEKVDNLKGIRLTSLPKKVRTSLRDALRSR